MLAAVAPARYQTRLVKDTQMLGNGRPAHAERPGQIGHRALGQAQSVQQSPARRIRDGMEGGGTGLNAVYLGPLVSDRLRVKLGSDWLKRGKH